MQIKDIKTYDDLEEYCAELPYRVGCKHCSVNAIYQYCNEDFIGCLGKIKSHNFKKKLEKLLS